MTPGGTILMQNARIVATVNNVPPQSPTWKLPPPPPTPSPSPPPRDELTAAADCPSTVFAFTSADVFVIIGFLSLRLPRSFEDNLLRAAAVSK